MERSYGKAADVEAAGVPLATASSILQSEVQRCSNANGFRAGGLAGWQIARVRSFIDQNLQRKIHVAELSAIAPQHEPLLAFVQTRIWSAATCLHRRAAARESLSPGAEQPGFAERDRFERWVF